MRVVMLLVVLTACGRFGFDESIDAGGAEDDAPANDASTLTPQYCDDRVVTTLSIPANIDPVAIRAVALSSGYALAIETSANDIQLLELSNTASLVATHMPFTPGYAPLYGISQHNERPVVSLVTGGSYFLKFVEPGWDAYATGPSGDPAVIDPAYAELGTTTGVSATISGGDFTLGIIDDIDVAAIRTGAYTATSTVGGSIVPTATGARVVVEKASGTCETFIVAPTGATAAVHTFSPCYAPEVAATDDTTVILHRTAQLGPFAVHVVPPVASELGTTYPLAAATYARVGAREDGAIWVGHGSGGYRAFLRFANGAMTESNEATRTYAFDLTRRDAFWIQGRTVHVSTPCLR